MSNIVFSSLPQGRLLSCQQSGKSHDFCRAYRYGDQVRIIYFKRQTALPGWEGWEQKEHMFQNLENDGNRWEENLIRARSRILELALCNDWGVFCTLTLDPLKYDRYSLHAWRRDLSQWIRDQRKRGKGDLRYLLIPEQHQDGAWHMHGLLAGIPEGDLVKNGNGYLDWPRYRRKFGYISIDPIRNKVAVSRYITKYIRKGTDETAAALDSGRHLYYHSRGLQGRALVFEGEVRAPDSFWQWQNEYIKSSWIGVGDLEQYLTRGDGR